MAVKLETEAIRTIVAFEKITNVQAMDCIMGEDCIFFLVDPEKIGVAIGKGGMTIKNVSRVLGKPVKLFGFSDNLDGMLKNLVPQAKEVETSNGSVVVTVHPKDRTEVIGRNGRNIKAIREILKRHFDVEIKLR